MAVSIRNMAGIDMPIPQDAIDGLRASIRGEVLDSGAPGYDAARAIWNAMIDRRPALIVAPRGAADVVRTIDFVRDHQLLLAVRGGGHNIAGNGVCDGGVVLDLSRMRSVRVDPQRCTAVVEAGCTLGDFDHDAQVFGLATPVGINSTTGIAGLTLGGGFGWLTRKHGLTIDNLLSADVVTADGRLVHASATENDDLFWAIRGGGGNFGVVTAFEFQLHPVGPQVLSGLIVHPFADARRVLQHYRAFAATSAGRTGVPGSSFARRRRSRSCRQPSTARRSSSWRYSTRATWRPASARSSRCGVSASRSPTSSGRIRTPDGSRPSTPS